MGNSNWGPGWVTTLFLMEDKLMQCTCIYVCAKSCHPKINVFTYLTTDLCT